MSIGLRFIIIPLLAVIVGLGAYGKITGYLETLRLAEQKTSLAQQKMIKQYDQVIADLSAAKAKENKTDHDVWYVKHLEKTRLHLERYLPYQDESKPLLSTFMGLNLVVIENVFMLLIMLLAAMYYLLKGRALKKNYPLTPGLKKVRYRQPATDSVADKTYWHPMRPGGASFQTHSLLTLSHDKLLLKSSGQVKAFFMLFVLVGVNGMVFSLLKSVQQEGLEVSLNNPVQMVESLFSTGLIFVIAGLVLGSMFGSLDTLFNKKLGLLSNNAYSANKASVLLYKIHALQIIEETVGSKGGGFNSYELNVVLKDGQRIHLMDHGNYLSVNSDAEKLAEFLAVPIWEN